MGQQEVTIFWFRRDLRLEDNSGLFHALKNNDHVLPVFIFDTNILDKLENRSDKRVEFIWIALKKIHEQLEKSGSSLQVIHNTPLDAFRYLVKKHKVRNVYCNNDYEPYAESRDAEIRKFLSDQNIGFFSFKDQVIFEKKEIIKDNGTPYTVFTPYMKKWKSMLNKADLQPFPTSQYFKHFLKTAPFALPSLESLGFISGNTRFSAPLLNEELIGKYKEQRDYPSKEGTSRLSIHLRFGTISTRKLVANAMRLSETWLNELIWREFYMMILYNFPYVEKRAFKRQYDNISWRNNEKEFEAWCKGETGYPIVDAGMRELNKTGFMHNRVRMIVASFLVKHLLIDWRWGEAYFAEKLLDYDLAANNGGWQWAAGSGCDAAPYFRIFNPTTQTLRFDPKLDYIRKWVPEFDQPTYLKPIVDHKFARERVLQVFKLALNQKETIL